MLLLSYSLACPLTVLQGGESLLNLQLQLKVKTSQLIVWEVKILLVTPHSGPSWLRDWSADNDGTGTGWNNIVTITPFLAVQPCQDQHRKCFLYMSQVSDDCWGDKQLISLDLYLDFRTSGRDNVVQCNKAKVFKRQIFYSTTARDYFGTILIEDSWQVVFIQRLGWRLDVAKL